LTFHVDAPPDFGATPSMNGIDSVNTLVMKALRLGTAAAPDQSLYFSVEEKGLLG